MNGSASSWPTTASPPWWKGTSTAGRSTSRCWRIPRGGRRRCCLFTRSIFREMPADRPRIVSFEGKWVEGSVDYRGTRPVPCSLPAAIRDRVRQVARAAFAALELRDYGRVDIRLSSDGTPWVIDVNPNCDLSREGAGFSRAARAAGHGLRRSDPRLLALAMKRRQDADTIPLALRSRAPRRDNRPERSEPDGEPVSTGGSGVRHRAPRGGAGFRLRATPTKRGSSSTTPTFPYATPVSGARPMTDATFDLYWLVTAASARGQGHGRQAAGRPGVRAPGTRRAEPPDRDVQPGGAGRRVAFLRAGRLQRGRPDRRFLPTGRRPDYPCKRLS